MDERARIIAENESRFREINERLRKDLRALPHDAKPVEFVCECGMIDCADPVLVTLEEYETVREDAMQFVVVPGHQMEDVEDVVADSERFMLIRKHAESSEVVRERDPRSGA